MEIDCGFPSAPPGHGPVLLARFGPTLAVDVGFDPAWRPTATQPPVLASNGLPALIDTGAAESCIDQILAASLGLPIVDRKPISGSAGKHEVNMYLAQIHVPSLAFTQHGMFAGVDLQAGGQVHKALIGRTFLMAFELHYEGHSGAVRLKKVGAPPASAAPAPPPPDSN